jgi:hypothetical protein
MNNQPNPIEVDGRISALIRQRDSLANEVVMLSGILALRDAKILELEKSFDEATGSVGVKI